MVSSTVGSSDHHRLEAALEGGVFLDMCLRYSSSVVAPMQCKFAAGEHCGLSMIGGIDGALGGAGADERVQFVDEQDNLPSAGGDFLEHALRRSSNSPRYFAPATSAEIQRDQRLVLE